MSRPLLLSPPRTEHPPPPFGRRPSSIYHCRDAASVALSHPARHHSLICGLSAARCKPPSGHQQQTAGRSAPSERSQARHHAVGEPISLSVLRRQRALHRRDASAAETSRKIPDAWEARERRPLTGSRSFAGRPQAWRRTGACGETDKL